MFRVHCFILTSSMKVVLHLIMFKICPPSTDKSLKPEFI